MPPVIPMTLRGLDIAVRNLPNEAALVSRKPVAEGRNLLPSLSDRHSHKRFGRSFDSSPRTQQNSFLLLIRWHFGQGRRLELTDGFGFLFFLEAVEGLPRRIHQSRRNKDDEIALDVLLGVGAEQASD